MTTSANGQSTIAQKLAAHYHGIDYSTLSAPDVAACKALLLDYTGVALCGSATESGRLASHLSIAKGGTLEATVIGTTTSVPADDAAFANAIAAHSLELDDVDQEALFHFSPPVISTALAAGEAMGCSGRELITAVFCGCEMMEQLSRAANPALRNRGFHTTAATGVFGATIAGAVIMKLSEEKMVNALGLAGAQASGLMEMYGSNMQKRFNPGPAARNGITAVRLAKLGFTGAETIFEGERGFLNAFAGGSTDIGALIPQAGNPYRLEVEFKAYACARPIHPAIDAVLTLRPQITSPVSRIEGMRIHRHPMWAHYHTNNRPRSYHEAQVSLPYAAAVALSEGDAFLDQFEQFEVMLAKVSDLMGKITISPSDGMPTTVSCRVEITIAGGKMLSSQVDHPKGSIQNPMTAVEREAKFTKLATRVIPREKVRKIVELVNNMEKISLIGDFTKHLKF